MACSTQSRAENASRHFRFSRIVGNILDFFIAESQFIDTSAPNLDGF